MFGSIAFGQVVFAGEPVIAVVPPPPPPPPPPPVPTYSYDCRFAIGQVTGTAIRRSPIPLIGTASGPGTGSCP